MTIARAGRPATVLTRLLPPVVVGVVGATAGHSIAGMSVRVPKPLALLLAAAGAAILLTITSTQLFLGWLFLAPLFQESASNTRVGHALALALYVAPPLVLVAKFFTSDGKRLGRRWVDLLPAVYVAFVVGSLVVTASGELRSGAVGTLRALYQNVALGVIVYYLVAFWRGRAFSRTAVARVLLLAAALQAAMAAVEWATGWNLWQDTRWQNPGDTRAIATLANPAVTGAFIGVGIVLALAILCWTGPRQLHRLAGIMLVVGLPGLYATKTRGPILATVVAALLVLLLSKRSRVVGLGVVAVVVLLLVVFWPQIRSSAVYQTRFAQKQNVEARLVLQDVSVKLIEKRPILGWGYDSFDRVKYDVAVPSGTVPLAQALQSTSHDTFLTMLVEYGVVGFVLFLFPWLAIGAGAVRRLRTAVADRWFLVAGLASILLLAINGATLDYRFFSFVPMLGWMFLGLLRRELRAPAPA